MKPRVVVLTPFFRPIMGGVESNAERLARYFGSIGFPVTVLTKRLTPDLPDAESGDGFSIARIGRYGPRSPSAKWMMLRPVYRWLVSHRNDHDVLCSIDCRGVGLAALAARRKTGRRVIAQPQTTGVLVPESGTGVFRQAAGRFAGRLYAQSDAIACIARRIEREALAAGVARDRVHYLPNAIDMSKFRPPTQADRQSMKQKLGLDDGAMVCVFLGRLSREKGLMDLMEAWNRLRPARAVLVVAGPDMTDHAWDVGPAARAYAQQHGLASSIRFIGPVDDVPALMGAADIVIQPSHFEALGLSAVEALACGVPVVASAVGGLLDFVRDGENGVTCPPHSPDALAAAIGTLLTDDGRRQRLASRARASVETVYDEQAVFGRFADLVRSLSGVGA
jgi:glycosyltransferase involved in cell wall biosynthesis